MMVFFGDPETRGEAEDARACARMAIDMRERLHALQPRWAALGIAGALHVRIGINTGFCTVGNFGAENRLDYTAIGGAVNLASRLESAAEPDEILASEETYELVRDEIECRERGVIQAKGIARPVRTYAIVGSRESAHTEASLDAKGDGFFLSLDPSRLSEATRAAAIAALEQALRRLRRTSRL